jgi:uncharacterized membrane protein YqjE
MSSLFESAQNLVAGLLDLGRTRVELFSVELREELARLAITLVGGMAVLILALFAVAFGAVAVVLSVSEPNRLLATVCVAAAFLVAAGAVALWLRQVLKVKPRAFDATLSELRRDLTAIKP